MKDNEVIDVEQAATLLRIPRSKVQRWVQQGQIPCKFKGKDCRFKKKEVVDWAKARNLKVFDERDPEGTADGSRTSLKTGIERGGVHFGLDGVDAASAFRHALKKIPFPSHIDKRTVLEALICREKIASTGIGKGVAIPHPRRPLPFGSYMIPVFFLEKSINFHSIDGKPVSVLFFLFSSSTEVHLNLLSKLSYCLREPDFLSSLRKCRTSKGVIELVDRHESRLGRHQSK